MQRMGRGGGWDGRGGSGGRIDSRIHRERWGHMRGRGVGQLEGPYARRRLVAAIDRLHTSRTHRGAPGVCRNRNTTIGAVPQLPPVNRQMQKRDTGRLLPAAAAAATGNIPDRWRGRRGGPSCVHGGSGFHAKRPHRGAGTKRRREYERRSLPRGGCRGGPPRVRVTKESARGHGRSTLRRGGGG